MKTKKTRTSRSLQRMVRHPALSELVNEQRKHVIEVLQLWGDFPDCDERLAVSCDWTHVLMERMATLLEHCRLDESELEVIRDIRRDLAHLVATCEEWDKKLMGERMPNAEVSDQRGAGSLH